MLIPIFAVITILATPIAIVTIMTGLVEREALPVFLGLTMLAGVVTGWCSVSHAYAQQEFEVVVSKFVIEKRVVDDRETPIYVDDGMINLVYKVYHFPVEYDQVLVRTIKRSPEGAWFDFGTVSTKWSIEDETQHDVGDSAESL